MSKENKQNDKPYFKLWTDDPEGGNRPLIFDIRLENYEDHIPYKEAVEDYVFQAMEDGGIYVSDEIIIPLHKIRKYVLVTEFIEADKKRKEDEIKRREEDRKKQEDSKRNNSNKKNKTKRNRSRGNRNRSQNDLKDNTEIKFQANVVSEDKNHVEIEVPDKDKISFEDQNSSEKDS